jgi:AbrB family looped-hinge helix DNA binding protein
MKNSSVVSSKGRITVLQQIRMGLGLKTGDRVEFVVEDDRTVIRSVSLEANPLEKFMGITARSPLAKRE